MIRQATENDAKEVAKIIVSGWQTAYRGIISNEFLDNMSVEKMTKSWEQNIKTQDENNNICVYEDENNILGVIRFGKADNSQSENGEIHVLYVKPELKRRGIGTELVKHAKEKLTKQKYKKMEIWCAKENKPSIEFYKKMGGKLRNNRTAEINGVKIEEVELIYNLEDKINLIKPTKEYENQAIEYKQEHFNNGEKKIHASHLFDKIEDYNEWLNGLERDSKEETVKQGWTVQTTFFGVRENDNKIVGMIDIRHELINDFLRNYAGHIGYGIRPTERRKGYATQMLSQALEYCKKELHLEKVMISCDKENEGSRKTIINAGGILEKEYMTDDGENVQVYWIKI